MGRSKAQDHHQVNSKNYYTPRYATQFLATASLLRQTSLQALRHQYRIAKGTLHYTAQQYNQFLMTTDGVNKSPVDLNLVSMTQIGPSR